MAVRYCNVSGLLKELGLPDLPKEYEEALKRLVDLYGVNSYEYSSLACDIVLYEGDDEWKRMFVND
jgi:hypothetical protein